MAHSSSSSFSCKSTPNRSDFLLVVSGDGGGLSRKKYSSKEQQIYFSSRRRPLIELLIMFAYRKSRKFVNQIGICRKFEWIKLLQEFARSFTDIPLFLGSAESSFQVFKRQIEEGPEAPLGC